MSRGCRPVLFSQVRTVASSSLSTRLDRVLPKRWTTGWTTGWTTLEFRTLRLQHFRSCRTFCSLLPSSPSGPRFEHTRRAVLRSGHHGDGRRSGTLFGARASAFDRRLGCGRRHLGHRQPSAVLHPLQSGQAASVLAPVAAPLPKPQGHTAVWSGHNEGLSRRVCPETGNTPFPLPLDCDFVLWAPRPARANVEKGPGRGWRKDQGEKGDGT
jgi:hypothetical protein